VSPVSGPPNINAELTGNNFFESESVDIYFGEDTVSTTATASSGTFTHTYKVPSGTSGPLHIVAVGRTSNRVAISLFRRLPDQPLPDPYSYSQRDPSTYHLNTDGGDPRWNSPSIQLYDDATATPVSSHDLKVGSTYRITATIYNDAAVDAANTLVEFEWAPFGVGQKRVWQYIGDDTIKVPSGGSETAETRWTPYETGHSCIVAKINHRWDEYLENNEGQENTIVLPVSSPGTFTFNVYNPTGNNVTPHLEVKQLGSEDVWETEISRDPPQELGPGEYKEATFYVNPPIDIPTGEKQIFIVTGKIAGELIGGIEVEVVKKQKTGLTCTSTPKTVTVGESVSITGSLTPVLAGAKIVIIMKDPDGDVSTQISSTASDGTYTTTFTPSITGTWQTYSTWMGDDTHMGASSIQETFNVEESKSEPEPKPEIEPEPEPEPELEPEPEPEPAGDPFNIDIEPKEASISTQKKVTYNCKIEASPDFDESISFKIRVNSSFWNIEQHMGTIDPPYPQEFSYDLEIPEYLPEEATVTVTIIGTSAARGIEREYTVQESVKLTIHGPSIPGFPIESVIIGLILGILIIWKMRARSQGILLTAPRT
jgi:hypothetical protein